MVSTACVPSSPDNDSVQSSDSHSQTLPRGAVWSRLRCKLKSRPARSCLKWVLSMISALSGRRKRWSLPSAGPRVRGTPSPRGPERAVNILSSRSPKIALSRDGALSDPIPDTLTAAASSRSWPIHHHPSNTPRLLFFDLSTRVLLATRASCVLCPMCGGETMAETDGLTTNTYILWIVN